MNKGFTKSQLEKLQLTKEEIGIDYGVSVLKSVNRNGCDN